MDSESEARYAGVVLTDIVGSTNLKQQAGEHAYERALARHHEVVRGAIERLEGRVLNDMGDGMLFCFDNADRAVRASLDIRNAIDESDWRAMGLPGRLRLRVSIHVGELREYTFQSGQTRSIHAVGLVIDICARLGDIASPDQILTSGAVYREAEPKLGRDRAMWLHHGRFRLKGVVDAIDVYEVTHPDSTFVQDETGGNLGVAQVIDLRPGSAVGRYEVLGEIGEGGFGVVYEAQQTSPVRRRVALKLIKAGMDSKAVLARFEAEQQALAVMDHPGIAKVLDAGVTRQGRPYFVMELVKGLPFTEYCDRERMSIDDRIRLFIDVCKAAQHAHLKGVVHRDIKPSNVMVTTDSEGKPRIKIIDFGVAKALNQKLTEATIHTEQGQLMGTLEYISPEQVDLAGIDVDTRADIYSLGVLLYETLTGALPFDREYLRALPFAELQNVIRETDVLRPSLKVSGLATMSPDQTEQIAKRRGLDARALIRRLRLDLDWVAARALEKSRDRRYPTAAALGEELARVVAGEPTQAGPPSTGYRIGRYVRRHRLPLTIGAVLLVALVLSLGALGVALHQRNFAFEQRTIAEQRLEREQEERNRARLEANNASYVSNQLVDLLIAPREYLERGLIAPTWSEVVLRAEQNMQDADFPSRELEAQMHSVIGMSLLTAGELERAIANFDHARSVRAQSETPDHAASIRDALLVSQALIYAQRFDDAAHVATEVLEDPAIANASRDPLSLDAREAIAIALTRGGSAERSVEMLESIVADRQAEQHDPLSIANSRYNLALAMSEARRPDEAADLMKSVHDVFESEAPRTSAHLNASIELAELQRRAGRLDDAIARFEIALGLCDELLPANHRRRLTARAQYAQALSEAGRHGQAIGILEETAEAFAEHHGRSNPRTVRCWLKLADAAERAGERALLCDALGEARFALEQCGDCPPELQDEADRARSRLDEPCP